MQPKTSLTKHDKSKVKPCKSKDAMNSESTYRCHNVWYTTVVFLSFFKISLMSRSYRKIPNLSPGLIEVRKHFLGGLYSGGLIFGGGLYSEGISC